MDINEFRRGLRFDPNDLLDERVCKEEKFFYNILKKLGVNQKLLDNPLIIRELEDGCESVLKFGGCTYDPKNPTKKQIKDVVEHFSKFGKILNEEEIGESWKSRQRWSESCKAQVYEGVEIDPETGSISFQHLAGGFNNKCELENRTSYSIDDNGNPEYNGILTYMNEHGEAVPRSEMARKFNSDGIIIEEEHKAYSTGTQHPYHVGETNNPNQKPFKAGQIIKHTRKQRDPENSLINKSETFIRDGETLAEPDTRYGYINPTDMYINTVEKNGEKIEGSREEILGYIESHKKEIKEHIAMARRSLAKWRRPGLLRTARESGMLEDNEQAK